MGCNSNGTLRLLFASNAFAKTFVINAHHPSIHTSGNKHIGNSAVSKERQYQRARTAVERGRGMLEECYTNLKPAVGKLVLLQIKLLDAAVILRNPT